MHKRQVVPLMILNTRTWPGMLSTRCVTFKLRGEFRHSESPCVRITSSAPVAKGDGFEKTPTEVARSLSLISTHAQMYKEGLIFPSPCLIHIVGVYRRERAASRSEKKARRYSPTQ